MAPGPSGSGVAGALSSTAHSSKRFVTCPVRCPSLFRAIVKQHAMTGSGLDRYKGDPASPRVSSLRFLISRLAFSSKNKFIR
ncbi:MAG: hypothetical protein Q7U51_04120 [Methanoregula sp.]|nr:hypothetical protein [Methanoregula sp.]